MQARLDRFLGQENFPDLYRSYKWKEDTYSKGFPNIFKLEKSLKNAAMKNELSKNHIIDVTKWGGFPLDARNSIRFKSNFAKLSLYQNDGRQMPELEINPLQPLEDLMQWVPSGLGPTYYSKVLRFALPEEYGAIDTKIVRVVGFGDPESKCQTWLDLNVEKQGYWSVSRYGWKIEYAKWINILRFFAGRLNNSSESPCPHHLTFIEGGLRSKGIWLIADVEMAIWSYASKHIKNEYGHNF